MWLSYSDEFFPLQIVEQDRKLDTALLQSGKFKDALVSLMDWLGETEEMVSSQKAPSTDYKVCAVFWCCPCFEQASAF